MIVIHPSKIENQGEDTIITSIIEIGNKREKLWYRFSRRYQKFLVTENLDAFLVAVLFLGLKTGNDITLKAPVSARLCYTLTHYLIPALVLANPKFSKIKIFTQKLNYTDLNVEKVAGTGMSCGIDSFATYFDHSKEQGPFKIKYFTFFNVGSHKDFGGENARRIFKTRLGSVNKFAEEEGVGLISVDSNLSEILQMNFQQTHSLRSVSCALHLQKLFKNYYYSSAYRLDHFELNSKDTSDSDIFNMQMLSTESTNFYASASRFSRVERTLLVAEKSSTYHKLDVCTNPQMDSSVINCSVCYKCLRTQITLDQAGKLQHYEAVFNLEKYRKIKNKYIGSLLAKEKKGVLDIELLNYLRNAGYRPTFGIYYHAASYLFIYRKNEFKKLLKNQLRLIWML